MAPSRSASLHTRSIRGVFFLFGFLALWLSSPCLAADDRQLVLGPDGTVFRLYEGTYGELFPEGMEASASHPVLALDILYAEGAQERHLVPGTESADVDRSSSIVFEKNTGVYVLWESLFNDLHPLLNLTSFDGVEWSDVIEIANGPFAIKGSPELVVTREQSRGFESQQHRTTLHVTWWQEAGGSVHKRYAPIFILDGRYSGWSPVVDLAAYVVSEGDPFLAPVPGLEYALSLRPGRDDRTVVAGFLNPQTHRLNTLQIEVLPQVLGNMADDARAQIIILGSRATTLQDLGHAVESRMLDFGSEFHHATLAYMAAQVRAGIESSLEELTDGGISSIADEARAQIIILGSQFGPDGLADRGDPQILEIGQSASGGEPYQYLKVSMISDRAAPEVAGPAKLVLSESGLNLVVTWEDGRRIYYRESVAGDWSEPSFIELTDDLDRETAYRMLEERVSTD